MGIAYSPNFSDGDSCGKIFGGSVKRVFAPSFGIYYSSIEDLHLFYEVGDAPYGFIGRASCRRPLEEPFRTWSDGISQGQRFPFVLPTPGDPANKNLGLFGIYLPIQGSPGIRIHNRCPTPTLQFQHSARPSVPQHGVDPGLCRDPGTPADSQYGIQSRVIRNCVLAFEAAERCAGHATMRPGAGEPAFTRARTERSQRNARSRWACLISCK